MRLSDREPQKLTKIVRETVLSGGMVSCGVGELWYGELWCGELWCSRLWPFFSYSITIPNYFFGQKLSLNIFSIIWYIFCQIKW